MRGGKKSRNGCATCKSKRLKCDEAKPACGRCTRLGVKCPGYVQSLRWVTRHEVLERVIKETQSQSSNSPKNQNESSLEEPPSMLPMTFQDDASQVQAQLAPFEVPLAYDPDSLLNGDQWDSRFNDALPELDMPPSPVPRLSFDFEQACSSSYENHDGEVGGSPQQTDLVKEHGMSSSSPSSIFLRQSPVHSPRSSSSNRLSVLPPLRRSLDDPSSTLIEYYFKEVAGLFSSYDSHMNPFRTTVSRLWGSSPAMCRTLQSMAAATLVDDFPQFGPVGLKLRKEAISMLEKQTVMDDKSLLALLMLGQTASWHNPNDLGISFFNLLRNHLNSITSGSHRGSLLTNRNNYQFFEEALIYWEMLLSYVADHSTLAPSAKTGLQTPTDSILAQRVPHPWTGIARDTQFTVHEVGRLIRRERNRVRARRFTSQRDIAQAQKAIQKARELEARLLSLAHPAETEIVNPGDDTTPVWHLLAMAEVYRYTGLIQLYRVFPDLLRSRLLGSQPGFNLTDQNPFSVPKEPSANPLAGFTDGVFSDAGSEYDEDTAELPESIRNEWLTTFALTAMSRLKTIPLESRTRCLQPFLLVASSSELRLPPINTDAATTTNVDANVDNEDSGYGLNLSSHAIEVSRTRKFILGRLSSFLHVLPPKPIHVCLKLVKEVWRRMDAGDPNVYWMDVMIDNGWETTMG
ncbi:hypothetical protein VTN77DRAFT_5074 [Rasamsonia byssochlamydoides]|uniref:uncharacterized protein n=1 Tax=Rasamsonia byssochlamydoides TaxID=89139 RepID=UPI00374309E1